MHRQTPFCGFLAVAMVVCGACERDRASNRPQRAHAEHLTGTPDAGFNPLSASEALRAVRRFRTEGALHRIKPHLLPEQREAVIDYLLGVDELVTAYRVLNKIVGERIGVGSATAFDPQAVANIVGVFSADVEIVDEVVEGNRATVIICVAGRVPLDAVPMVMREGRWLIETDRPIPGLTEEIRKLARTTDRVVLDLKSHEMTAQQVRDELNLRQSPILARIKELTEAERNSE